MPGTIVRTETRSGPTNPVVPEAGRFLMPGMFDRGPTDKQTRVRSVRELERTYGRPVPYSLASHALRNYFEDGGYDAHVVRVVGPAATVGTLTLVDRAGAPVPTLRIDAASAGAWSTDVTIAVEDGSAAGTYALVKTVTQPDGSERTSRYDDLVDPAAAVTALARDEHVRAVNLVSVTAAPDNLPAVAAAEPLSAGDDDRDNVTAAVMVEALDLFPRELGAGIVGIPGFPLTATAAGLRAHAKDTERIYTGALALDASEDDAVTFAEANTTADGEYGGPVWPWVTIPDGRGGEVDVSPEGFVAAARARAHRLEGPWRAPAGELSVSRFILRPVAEVDRDAGDRLDEAGVSAIRTIAGTTRLYGYRSLSTDLDNYSLLTFRDVLNVLVHEARRQLEPYVFRSIDGRGQLYAELEGTLTGLVAGMARAGGLYARIVDGQELDPGYAVSVASVNDDLDRVASRVEALLTVRPSPVGTLIDLTIVRAGLTAAV